MIVAFTSTNYNYSYSFTVPANRGMVKTSTGYKRQTSNVNNAWKINLKNSAEDGTGRTFTQFCICLNDKTAASAWYSIQETTGDYFKKANDAAGWKTVYLGARDNNNIASSYKVSGVWDEETGVILN